MILGVDAGGTYLRAELYKGEKLVSRFQKKSAQIALSAFLESIIQEHEGIEGIGISYAGQVHKGVILGAPNIKVDEANIAAYFKSRYGIELFIENDLNCAVLAEASACESEDICALYVGTGIGLGAISGGRLIRGAWSVATEVGHIPYKKAPFVCGCGRDNCLELYASGSGLAKWLEYYDLEPAMTLESLQKSEDSHAKIVYENFIEALLFGCGTTVTLLNPSVLVLGGGIIEANPWLCDIIKRGVGEVALGGSLLHLQIKQTSLQNAPLRGALLLKDYQ
ncbi:MAG: ROK family protein [Epsilonproteobacteria bacterium]|nr:ROK family protein [Campylobacterota bacterium]